MMSPEIKAKIDSLFEGDQIAADKYYLDKFRKEVYPPYAEHGFSLAEALIADKLRFIDGTTQQILTTLEKWDDE